MLHYLQAALKIIYKYLNFCFRKRTQYFWRNLVPRLAGKFHANALKYDPEDTGKIDFASSFNFLDAHFLRLIQSFLQFGGKS